MVKRLSSWYKAMRPLFEVPVISSRAHSIFYWSGRSASVFGAERAGWRGRGVGVGWGGRGLGGA